MTSSSSKSLKSKSCFDKKIIFEDDLFDNAYMSTRSMLLLGAVFFLAIIVSAVSIGCALFMYQFDKMGVPRYYCSVPLTARKSYLEPNFRHIRWSPEPEAQIMSTLDDSAANELIKALREELDIGDTIEKISVTDNGRRITFIHDFEANKTGIIDTDRCFTMEMESEVVMLPTALASGLQRGDTFDVSRKQYTMRAKLPIDTHHPFSKTMYLRDVLFQTCKDKPVYELEMVDEPARRKRTVDELPHDYIHFSGRHVQEIVISNMADLLQQEQNARNQT